MLRACLICESPPQLARALPEIRARLEAEYDLTLNQLWEPSPTLVDPSEHIYSVMRQTLPEATFKAFPGATDQFAFHTGLAYVPVRWPGGLHMTFSQHAAMNRWSKIYYSLFFLITLPLLLWFFIAWLVPERSLPAAFMWFAIIAVVFQIACTFVPEVGGVRTKIHRVLTGISGVAMLPLVTMLVLAQRLSFLTKFVALEMLVVMLVLLTIALRYQKGHNKALLLQIGYYAGFFIAVLAATYIG